MHILIKTTELSMKVPSPQPENLRAQNPTNTKQIRIQTQILQMNQPGSNNHHTLLSTDTQMLCVHFCVGKQNLLEKKSGP
jgi:hypothetical protein